MTLQTLTFDILPEDVRIWLASETVANRIMNMNDRLKPRSDKRNAIALLVHRIAVRNLPPAAAAGELRRELGLDEVRSRSLTRELFESVFQPIERTLRSELNIEVADMVAGGASESSGLTTPVVAPEVATSEPKRVDFGVSEPMPKSAPSTSSEQASPPPPPPETKQTMAEPEPELGDQPFLIHEEKPQTFMPPREPRQGFSFKPREAPNPPSEAAKPVQVRIETPEKPKKPASRVVHYSNLRTPLDDTDAK